MLNYQLYFFSLYPSITGNWWPFQGGIFKMFFKGESILQCGAWRIFCQHNMWILFLAQSDWWTSKLGKKTKYVYKHRKLIIFILTKFGKLYKSVLFITNLVKVKVNVGLTWRSDLKTFFLFRVCFVRKVWLLRHIASDTPTTLWVQEKYNFVKGKHFLQNYWATSANILL